MLNHALQLHIDNLGNGVTDLSGEIGKISLYVVSALVKDP